MSLKVSAHSSEVCLMEKKYKKDLDKYFEIQPKVRPIFRFLAMWDKIKKKKTIIEFLNEISVTCR